MSTPTRQWPPGGNPEATKITGEAITRSLQAGAGRPRVARRAGPRILGALVIDLRGENDWAEDHRVTRLIHEAADAPADADVTLIVAAGQWPPPWALDHLRHNGRHLRSVTVQSSDSATIRRWVGILRGEGRT